MEVLGFVLALILVSNSWRLFVETAKDLGFVRLLEPWYWFILLNLVLSWITSNYDYQFVLFGLIIQLALCVWFSLSIGWMIQSCPHKTGVLVPSRFSKGKSLKFCYRCGTRLPQEVHTHLIKDSSWSYWISQTPPYLLEFIVFWTAQSLMVLIVLFLALRILRKPVLQHEAALIAVFLVILMPPVIYCLGRFRKYLDGTKGLIWWEDLKNSLLSWSLVLLFLWGLAKWIVN